MGKWGKLKKQCRFNSGVMECERSGWLNSKAALIIEWKEGFGGGQNFIGLGWWKRS